MMLHLVNKSPWADRTLEDCLRLAAPGDALLLIEDGVYAVNTTFVRGTDGLRLYALQDDVRARGLEDKLQPEVQLVDYAGFVALTVEYNRIQSWY